MPQTEPLHPLIYDIQLTRNPQGIWIARFGDIYGKPAATPTEALATVAAQIELHRELADLLLSPLGIASMLTRNTDRKEAVK